MKRLIVYFFIFLFSSCDSSLGFDKNYYEKVAFIKFPKSYNLLATADNGEYRTISILEFDQTTCNRFIQENNFHSMDERIYKGFRLTGLSLLDTTYRQQPDIRYTLIRGVDKVNGKVGWTYLIDTMSCRLYCQIDYPDRGGN